MSELSICLKDKKTFYPGDTIKGLIILDLRRAIDVQHISITFSGTIEACGEKILLINETQLLATPKGKQNYTNLGTGQVHEFDFSFKIPKDKKLPSSVSIPKLGKVVYMLTATHKKPRFKFSPTLSSTSNVVCILDMIDINSLDYQKPMKTTDDIGFINGSKPTQWSLHIPRSAFSQGDTITVDCQINNLPTIKKPRALKLSLIRQIHKTSSGKILDNKTLSFEFFDLNVNNGFTSSQSIRCDLNIPPNTPPNIFPDTGRVLSVSYLIKAELCMKGVKSAIKLKSVYEQQVSIVVGTYSSCTQSVPIENRIYGCSSASNIQHSTDNLASQSSIYLRDSSHTPVQNLLLSNHNLPPITSPISAYPISDESSTFAHQNNEVSNTSLPTRRASGMGSVTHISPLARLETVPEHQRPKSYIPLKPNEITERTFTKLSPSRVNSDLSLESNGGHVMPTSFSSICLTTTPTAAEQHDLECAPHIIQKRHSFSSKAVPHIDRSMTPLPPLPPLPPISSLKLNDESLYNGYLNHRKSKYNLINAKQDLHIIHSVPHEIGPNDIITMGNGKTATIPVPLIDDKVQTTPLSIDDEKLLNQKLPDLLRNDTVSSSSTNSEFPPDGVFHQNVVLN